LIASLGRENEVVKKDNIFSSLCFGIVFYIILNFFILYVLKIQAPLAVEMGNQESTVGSSLVGELFGLQINRTIFPLSSYFGIPLLASIVGLVAVRFCIKIIYLKSIYEFSFLNTLSTYIYVFICLLMLLFLDTRGTIVSLILVLTFFVLINLNKSKFKHNIIYVQLIFIANVLFPFISGFVSEFLQPISQEYGQIRGGSLFTDREIIWNSAITFFSTFDLENIIGYGAWGQYTAGFASKYSMLFSGVYFHTLHSTNLQQLVNVGYFGLFIYLSLTFFSIVSLVKYIKISQRKIDVSHLYAISYLACILYLMFVGNFESVINQDRIFLTNIYLLLIMPSLTVIPTPQDLSTDTINYLHKTYYKV